MKKLCLIFGICCVASSGCFGKDAYQFLSDIPIGGEGGWDILTIDPTANRLYLSHATKVVVVDLAKNSVIGEITDTPGVHAFVAVPELQRGFSSNGKEDKASVVDLKTLKTISKIDTGRLRGSIRSCKGAFLEPPGIKSRRINSRFLFLQLRHRSL